MGQGHFPSGLETISSGINRNPKTIALAIIASIGLYTAIQSSGNTQTNTTQAPKATSTDTIHLPSFVEKIGSALEDIANS